MKQGDIVIYNNKECVINGILYMYDKEPQYTLRELESGLMINGFVSMDEMEKVEKFAQGGYAIPYSYKPKYADGKTKKDIEDLGLNAFGEFDSDDIPASSMQIDANVSYDEARERVEEELKERFSGVLEVDDFWIGDSDVEDEKRVRVRTDIPSEEPELKEIERSGRWDDSYSRLCDELATYEKGGEVMFHNVKDRGIRIWENYKNINNQQSVGSFSHNYNKRNVGDYYLFLLDDYDRNFYSHISLKPNEMLFRFETERGRISKSLPLIKINLQNGKVYFMSDDNDINSDYDDKNPKFQKASADVNYLSLDDRIREHIQGLITYDELSESVDKTYAKGGEISQKRRKENEIRYIDSLKSKDCFKPMSMFQSKFSLDLELIADLLKKIDKNFTIDTNPNNFGYTFEKGGSICLFDIEDVQDGGGARKLIEDKYSTIEPFENPINNDNYVVIGIGEASQGGVFLDKRDGSVIKLTASPFEVLGTHKVMEAQKTNEDYLYFFPAIDWIKNVGELKLEKNVHTKYPSSQNYYAIRRTNIVPFDTFEQKEVACYLFQVIDYWRIVENVGYGGEALLMDEFDKGIEVVGNYIRNEYLEGGSTYAEGGEIKKYIIVRGTKESEKYYYQKGSNEHNYKWLSSKKGATIFTDIKEAEKSADESDGDIVSFTTYAEGGSVPSWKHFRQGDKWYIYYGNHSGDIIKSVGISAFKQRIPFTQILKLEDALNNNTERGDASFYLADSMDAEFFESAFEGYETEDDEGDRVNVWDLELPLTEYIGKIKKSVKDYHIDSDSVSYYKQGGSTYAEGGVAGVKKMVYSQSGEFNLEEYQDLSNEEMIGESLMGLEEVKAKVFAYNEEAYDYEDEINEIEDVDDLAEFLYESGLAQIGNTYNQSWWGGVRLYATLNNNGDNFDLDYPTILFMSRHRGGDVRGNYEKYEAFDIEEYGYEQIPFLSATSSRLTYEVKDGDKKAVFETEDMDGYELYVVESDFVDFDEGDSTNMDEVGEKLGVELY